MGLSFGWLVALAAPTDGLPQGGPRLCSLRPPLPELTDEQTQRLDRRAGSAATSSGICQQASSWGFLEASAERIIWEGRLFDADPDEERVLQDAASTYEDCPGALLLALLACAARAASARNLPAMDSWEYAFAAWNSLPWTKPLAWHNLQDPLVRPALYAAVSQTKVLRACLTRPEDICSKVTMIVMQNLEHAAGMSLTVSRDGFTNLPGHSELSQSLLVLTNYAHLLTSGDSCWGARLLAHLFTARRLIDLLPDYGEQHVTEAHFLLEKLQTNGTLYGDFAGACNLLSRDLEVHRRWLRDRPATPQLPQVPPLLGALAIWERGLAPVFSESQKDLVLERIFAMIGTTSRFFVEVGTQTGEQCNTRYLRVRYGFHGLMLDDNFRNSRVNLKRKFITPANIVEIFQESEVPTEFDLLSLDTDGYEWLLWMKLNQAGYSPRVVVLEYGENLPYTEDVIIRYTPFPVHRLCLSQLQRFPKVSGASITSLLKLGRAWGYHLVHLVACGTSDLIFIREDAMGARAFPAQNDAAALCRLSAYQCEASEIWCATRWPGGAPPSQELQANAEQALAGDYELQRAWSMERRGQVARGAVLAEGPAILHELPRIETCYGDIAEFGGKGPETRRINAEGNSYLQNHFPRLSYIRRARPLDWTPPGGGEAVVEAALVPSRNTAQAAAREAQLRASEAGHSALLAAQAKDPEEAIRAAATARHAAQAAQAAAEAAEAASAALLGARGESWRASSPPRRSLAAPPGDRAPASHRSASVGSFRSGRSSVPFMIQRPTITPPAMQSARGHNSYVPHASLPSTPMWPQPMLPQAMAYVPQMASQASLHLPYTPQLTPQLQAPMPQQHLPGQHAQVQQLPQQQLPQQQLQQLPPQQLPPQQLTPQLSSQQLPPQQLPPQTPQHPFAQLLQQSPQRQPGLAQMPGMNMNLCLSPQREHFL
ncbi:unnamed protein product [Symbiodinium natans]|uniref:Methyltransferase FkbM domain-containing protein n=1 Tax=Symbiodinium natans TaxID=878477 RepID=A0A812MC24_9DINO|nr:unnamed protein product [Symbiodinium natans]